MGSNPLLVKTYTAATDILPRSLVKAINSNTVAQCTDGVNDVPMGVANEVGAQAGAQVDVILAGIAEVEMLPAANISLPAVSGSGMEIMVSGNGGRGDAFNPASIARNVFSIGRLMSFPNTNGGDGGIYDVLVRPMFYRATT